jgi:hypothetical protein
LCGADIRKAKILRCLPVEAGIFLAKIKRLSLGMISSLNCESKR